MQRDNARWTGLVAASALCTSMGLHAQSGPTPAPAEGTGSPATAPGPAEAAPSATKAPAKPAPTRAADTLPSVEIKGLRASDMEERRQSTAAKIIVGRDEIDKFGDSTVGEVLRRLPGVTTPGAPGRGGPPRMRGLGNGYTQLLIDGQRVPPGFSLESLTPDQIERIEILRAPTAETGARAIAGTINIITREGYVRRINDVRLGFGYENGQLTPGGSWTRNDTVGPLIYNVSASAFGNKRRSFGATDTVDTNLTNGSTLLSQHETALADERRTGLNLSSRLQWNLGPGGDQFSLSPTLFHTEASSQRHLELTQSVPGGTAPPYDLADAHTDSRFTVGRLNVHWRQRLAEGTRLELNGGAGLWRSHSDTQRAERANGVAAPLRLLSDTSTQKERSANLNLKWSKSLGGSDDPNDVGHSLVSGAEIETIARSEIRVSLQNGLPLLTDFGDDLQANSTRLAAYAQDEWNLNANWAAHAGLRWEGIQTKGDAGDGQRPNNRSSVWTPLLHAVWKPDPKSRDQVRLSLTRSYRAPQLASLIARPSLSSKFAPGVANDPTSPDRAGNPELKPELATGLDLAFERYLSGGGLLSANLFYRRIHDLMRTVPALETVSWSPVQRWVARPQNIGDAQTEGLELEAKFALDQAIEGAPRIEMRGNLALYQSRVLTVPGPDNRLDQQAKATGNVGADYRFRGTPLTLGGNFNWVPGYATQLEVNQRATVSSKRQFDAFALWTFSPAVALRLLASNWPAADYVASSAIDAAAVRETATSVSNTYTNWQLRLELKL